MGIIDDLINFIFPRDGSGGIFGSLFDSFWSIAFIIILVIGLLVVARIIRHTVTYAGSGEEIGVYRFHIQGLTNPKGNVNVRESITDAKLKTILKASKHYKDEIMEKGISEFKTRMQKDQLHIYDFRTTDYEEAFDLKGGKDAIILSPVDLEDKNFMWIDSKGERTWATTNFTLKSKNILCFSYPNYTEYLQDLEDEHGQEFDAYVLCPIPRTLASEMVRPNFETTSLNMTKLESGEALATLAQYCPTLAETFGKIVPAEKERDRLRDKLKDKDSELSNLHKELEDERHEAYPNPVVGHRHRKTFIGKMNTLMWIAVSVFAGGFGYGIPDFFSGLQGQNPLLFVALIMIVMLVLNRMFEKITIEEQDKEAKKDEMVL